MKKGIVFVSGEGTLAQTLIKKAKTKVVAVISSKPKSERPKLFEVCQKNGVLFHPFLKEEHSPEAYGRIVEQYQPDVISLAGWVHFAYLPSKITINNHPGPIPKCGGQGMYGLAVHKCAIEKRDPDNPETELNIHFATTKEYDDWRGIVYQERIKILPGESPEDLKGRVLQHEYPAIVKIFDMVANHEITWDGENNESIRVPDNYEFLPKKQVKKKVA